MESNLGVLGTLGNNAPFIGLFGTVLGIIKAFARSVAQPGAAARARSWRASRRRWSRPPSACMVAIPAVIAFNFFQGKVRKTLARVDAIAHLVLATLRATANARAVHVAARRRLDAMAGGAAASATTTIPGG